MAQEGAQFKNLIKPLGINDVRGKLAYQPAANAPYEGAMFSRCTGDTNYPDATPGQASNITLVSAAECPAGMRPYLTRVDVDVQGAVNWSSTSPTAGSIPSLSIRDTNGVPALIMPYSALRGLAAYTFPDSDIGIPLLFGPNTVNSAVGVPITTITSPTTTTNVITVGATSFVANYGVGGVVRVVDGTGKGLAAMITAVTATTLTVSPAFTAGQLDATSVIAVDYMTLQTYTDTTHLVLWAGGGTPYVANAFDNGFNVVGVLPVGAGVQGSSRPILSSTTAGALVLAFALNSAFTQATTMLTITNEPNLNGAVDCCIGDKWSTLSLNSGIQLVVDHKAGTAPVGSPVRVYIEGYFAP